MAYKEGTEDEVSNKIVSEDITDDPIVKIGGYKDIEQIGSIKRVYFVPLEIKHSTKAIC